MRDLPKRGWRKCGHSLEEAFNRVMDFDFLCADGADVITQTILCDGGYLH